MTLIDQLQNDLNAAVKAKDEVVTSTLRFLLSGIHNAKIAKESDLVDDEVTGEIAKEVKRHRESIEAFENAGRVDLAEKEKGELTVLLKYLPEPLSDEALENMVTEAIAAVGATSIADLGKVIKAVMGSVGSRAEGARVAQIARLRLNPNA